MRGQETDGVREDRGLIGVREDRGLIGVRKDSVV